MSATVPSPVASMPNNPFAKKPTETAPKDGAGGGGKLAAMIGGKPTGTGQGLGKLAALMKKAPATGSRNESGKSTSATPAAAAGNANGSGGLMGMLFLKKKLSKWRTSKLKTWNMNESTTSSVKSVMENSYRLEPERSDRFLPSKVKACIERVLQRRLREDTKYNPQTFAMLARLVADEIKEEVKALGFSRYKLVVHVMLGQNLAQGLQTASRCVWDPSTDNSATLTFRSTHICAVINVFGTYFE